ncbi:ectonucleoside triphosphate diphosphohydrolase 8 isoform X3 [Taeniopygia guttata]|uniref:ectonucleoside triphosphate diphosphohydrolase 8 isoform X3 n=1 Tax=Taeniopygia guttata TaxID=59729 RepID=UPI003BB862D8
MAARRPGLVQATRANQHTQIPIWQTTSPAPIDGAAPARAGGLGLGGRAGTADGSCLRPGPDPGKGCCPSYQDQNLPPTQLASFPIIRPALQDLASSRWHWADQPPPNHGRGCLYGLVFDAGSTHTSLYIYRWPADKENDTGIVSQVEACSVAGPGISSYADDPAGAGAGLKPCLDRAMKIVPAEQQRETPTYLGATAGMRLLREENSTKAEQVLAEVSKAIGEYPVDFRGARILTGSEEGSFGWITVNYLLETLVKFSFAEKWAHPQDTEVLGALDLGGASTQITFQPGVPVEDRNTSVFFRLYGTDYSLYSHSYLCYGQSQALKMLLAALHQASSRAQISHPCYPKGYKETITVAELYNSPCVRAPSSARPGLVLTVTGTGDTDTCHAAVQRLFDFSCGAQGPCGFNGVYQPPVRGHFFAFSGFYHSLHFLNLTGGQSLSLVNATIRKICNSSWKQVQELFPTASRTQIRDACTASSYTLTLLLQGYKFNVTTWPNIHFIRQVYIHGPVWHCPSLQPISSSSSSFEWYRMKDTSLYLTLVPLLLWAVTAPLSVFSVLFPAYTFPYKLSAWSGRGESDICSVHCPAI